MCYLLDARACCMDITGMRAPFREPPLSLDRELPSQRTLLSLYIPRTST
jgi:hypothetical protein